MATQNTDISTFSSTAFQTYITNYQSSALLALCEGNPLVTGVFPHEGPLMRKPCPCYDVFTLLQADTADVNHVTRQTSVASFVVNGDIPGLHQDDKCYI